MARLSAITGDRVLTALKSDVVYMLSSVFVLECIGFVDCLSVLVYMLEFIGITSNSVI